MHDATSDDASSKDASNPASASPAGLPAIPFVETGADFPMATLDAFPERIDALIAGATKGMPRTALKIADKVSRQWLVKSEHHGLAEIDAIAAKIARPGVYFLSVNYEWGCTVGVRSRDDGGAELVRVLDWRTPGLGRYIVAAHVTGAAAGDFVTLTWPGYTGVLQAMAPGRFSGAINQAPMPRKGGGFMPLDWLMNKVDVWRSRATTPAHLLRDVFEQSRTFQEARLRLIETPVASPAIFSLVGSSASELTIIERWGDACEVHDGPQAAANAWLSPGWQGRARGHDNPGRAKQMMQLPRCEMADFQWMDAPIRNPLTRLAMVSDARAGSLIAQGFEGEVPATSVLTWTAGARAVRPEPGAGAAA